MSMYSRMTNRQFRQVLRAGMCLWLFGVALAATPVVFWTSCPVQPDETLMLAGGNFGDAPRVEGARYQDTFELETHEREWQPLEPLQSSDHSLKVVMPAEWDTGVYVLRIRNGVEWSAPVLVNAPDAWWRIGDQGEFASPGGTLRVFGRTLNLGGESRMVLRHRQNGDWPISASQADAYSLTFDLPEDVPEGRYAVLLHNGHGGRAAWSAAGYVDVQNPPVWRDVVYNIKEIQREQREQGLGGTATDAMKYALEQAREHGGGVLYFPRGRYRIDETLAIPEFVVLRGESRERVSLYWPPVQARRRNLLVGDQNFTVEDLTLYADRYYQTMIRGNHNITVQRVRLRGNLFHQAEVGQAFRTPPAYLAETLRNDDNRHLIPPTGGALALGGNNIRVTDNDFYHTRGGAGAGGRNVVVARNRFDIGYGPFVASGTNMIFEDNDYRGSDPWASGIGVTTYGNRGSVHNLYFARNRMSQVYGNDREAVTLDGHGTAYLGKLAAAGGTEVVLAEDPIWGTGSKDMLPQWDLKPRKAEGAWQWRGISLYVLEGTGVGQFRALTGVNGRRIEVERPWDVPLDESSVVSIGKYNGRHLFIDNYFEDAGFGIQLYPPCYETIIAGNVMRRSTSHNSGGALSDALPWKGIRMEHSWYNQFLHNEIPEGNSWAGMGSEIRVYGVSTLPELTASRWHVMRGNVLENNAELRVLGSVRDVVVEGNQIRNSHTGILINSLDAKAAPWVQGMLSRSIGNNERLESLDQKRAVFDSIHRETGGGTPVLAAVLHSESKQKPRDILLRNNLFEQVTVPYIGDALQQTVIYPASRKVKVFVGDQEPF